MADTKLVQGPNGEVWEIPLPKTSTGDQGEFYDKTSPAYDTLGGAIPSFLDKYIPEVERLDPLGQGALDLLVQGPLNTVTFPYEVGKNTFKNNLDPVEFAGHGPAVGMTQALARGLGKTFPEGHRTEAIASALGTMAGSVINPYLGALTGPLAGFTANQIKQGLGLANPGEEGEDARNQILSPALQGVGGTFLGHRIAKGRHMGLSNAAGVAELASKRLAAFRDIDRQRAMIYTENPKAAVTRQGIPLVDALKDPELKSLTDGIKVGKRESLFDIPVKEIETVNGTRYEISYDPSLPHSRKRLPQRIFEKKREVGEKYDDILDQYPQDFTVTFQEIIQSGLGGVFDLVTGDAPAQTKAIATSVLKKELLGFGKNLLDPKKFAEYKTALSKTLDNPNGALTGEELGALIEGEGRIFDRQFTVKDLQKYKSEYGKLGRYDRVTDPDSATKADIYREFDRAFRNSFEDVLKGNSELYDAYKQNNFRYQALMDLEKLVMKRSNLSGLFGPFAETSTGVRQQGAGSLLTTVGDAMYPQRVNPEYRAKISQTDEWDRVYNPSLKIGQYGVDAISGLLNGSDQLGVLEGRLLQSQMGGPIISNMAAQGEITYAKTPRDTNTLFTLHSAAFPETLANDPDFNAMITKAQHATEEQRIDLLSEYLSSHTEQASEFFEEPPVRGFYGIVKGEDDQYHLKDVNQRMALAERFKRDEKDPLMLAEKLSALNKGLVMIKGRISEQPKTTSQKQSTVKIEDSAETKRQDYDY